MHADKLYHQMLDYEKRVEEAKEAGQAPPPLMSLFDPKQAAKEASDKRSDVDLPNGITVPEGFKPSKPLHQLTPHERELEIRAHNAQLEQNKLYAEEAAPFMKSHEESQARRKEKMSSWFGESIGKWFG